MGKKILIVRTSSMGDVVHGLPVAWDIKHAIPDCELHWAVEESFADVVALSPFVDRSIETAFRRWRKHPFSVSVHREIATVRKTLRGENYDSVIDMQGLIRSGLLSSWTGSPVSGFSRDTVREPLAAVFYTEKHRLPASLTPVPRYRALAAETLGYRIDASDTRFGLRVTAPSVLKIKKPYAALAVNSSSVKKLWPQENWKKLAAGVREAGLVPAFFWGNETERERVEEIAAGMDSMVVPRSSIAQTAAVLKGASAAVGVDSGLTHLAAALGVPTVELVFTAFVFKVPLVGEGPAITLGEPHHIPSADEAIDMFHKVLKENSGEMP